MAQLIRSAKSVSEWTDNELYAYHISITPTSPADFFQSGADPSLDHLDPSILTVSPADANEPGISEAASEYLKYLSLATHASYETAIDEFAAATLKLLGFSSRKTHIAIQYPIPLGTICGEKRSAQADVCVIYYPTGTILLVIDDKTTSYPAAGADAQVAEAIAVFQSNNIKRAQYGRPTLETMTIPCITMSGTTPTFYLVPVTKELSDAVATGQFPTSQTEVLKCITTATHQRQVSNGMADLEFRKIALKRFLAFKDLAESHWRQYMI